MAWILGAFLLVSALVVFFQWQAAQKSDHPEEPVEDDGGLRTRRLRKDNISKEVEVAWEASDLIEIQPGAWAPEEEFRDSSQDSSPDSKERPSLAAPENQPEEYCLPGSYGKDRLVLMARDPNWIYAYWEVTHERYQETLRKHLTEWGLSCPILRLYDMTPDFPGPCQVDYYLNDYADNWYLHMPRPRHTFVAEYGRIFPDKFVPVLRSNAVTLPPGDVSDEFALEWAPLDWQLHYGRFARETGTSSFGVWRKDQK